jgi:O-acetyl-ADP-ribose deacetylase
MGEQPIEQVKGDLLAQDVDCIVNAANEHLQMGGGVAGAIRRADGSGQIQAECDAIVDRQGIVPVGGAVLTRGGDLGPVIHAVGPVYSKAFPDRSTQELYQAYLSALTVAHEAGFRTIAFPYISTGIFGFPREEGVMVALRASQDFLDEHPDSFDLIRFVSLE